MTARCEYCGAPLPPPAKTGRRRRFCSDRCRVAAHRERGCFTVDDVAAVLVPRTGVGGVDELRPIGPKLAAEILTGTEGFVARGLVRRVNGHGFAVTDAGRELALELTLMGTQR